MGFLAPISFLFFGAIPILLLFYFFKKQYDRQTISSIYLWEGTLREWESDRWWHKLQRNLLLLLQLLILLLLILALARPFFVGEEVNGDHLVIVIDSSATMTAEENGTTRFTKAKQQAVQLIDQLGNGHKVSVIHAQEAPVLLATNQTNHSEVIEQIKELQISYQHQNVTDSIRLAQSLIQHEQGEIHIFTDDLDEESVTALNISIPVVVRNMSASKENISIQTFGVKRSENLVQAIVTVKNESSDAIDIVLSISNDENELEQVTEGVAANEQKTINVKNLPIHDYYQVKLVGDDAYNLDNVMHALLPKQEAPSIYLAGDVNPFIEKAILSAGIKVTTVPTDDSGNYSFPEEEEAVYLLSGVENKHWPPGAKLIISPSSGGPFQVGEKVQLNYPLKEASDHPVLAFSDFENVYLEQAYQVDNWQGLQPLVKSEDQIIIAKGMFENDPMILLAFDLFDSDWPLQPGFPILLVNSIADLAGDGESLGYYHPLETATIQLSTMTEGAVIEELNGDDLKDIHLSESDLTVPRHPGIYQLHEKSANGSSFRYLVVQLDNVERTATSINSFSVDVEGQEESGTQLAKKEVWRIFASLALLLLFLEWEVYRRGISSR
ncbi:vWA domain-containing protein [Aquibacillus saliphilus]|uniref:vWA domain-containing protein n=1 Tax=Aquibacillus saliphilus TaxID=1909422 RepID=UPI001CF0190F|nr:BatA and WFA domain-containing protein [Aquibacillus saliphilus]